MPLGRYPAQGLAPRGLDSRDDDEGHCELPDGRMVCGPHGIVVCGRCCLDFSSINDDQSDMSTANDPSKVLVFSDGACLNNGQPNPRAGWAFVFGPGGICSGRLESRGPFDDPGVQSSNRAELCAVIAAIGFRAWHGEGFRILIIATDSEYVVKGATAWVKTWLRKGWRTNNNADVKNKDLWEMLLGE
ncbi:unnamed protein product, partial [Clonostachys rhizophaga]